MEEINVPMALQNLVTTEIGFDPRDTTYFLGRVTIFATDHTGMAGWRKRLFILMSRNARSAALFFAIPPERVIEVGSQITL